MKIEISSNILSGAYVCLDLITFVVLSHLLSTLVGCWNVKKVHDDGKMLHLTSSPVALVANYGLATKGFHSVVLLTLPFLNIITKIGAFSILGVTGTKFEQVSLGQVVSVAPQDELLDFQEHVSIENRFISGTLLLFLDIALCLNRTTKHLTYYQYSNNLQDLRTTQWRLTDMLQNSTCLTAESKFNERIALQFDQWYPPGEYLSSECAWSVNSDNLAADTAVQVNNTQDKGCAFPALETWCIRSSTLYCASISRVPGGFANSLLMGAGTPRLFRRDGLLFPTRPPSTVLRSMALLMAAGLEPIPDVLAVMTLLRVETNVPVGRVVGERDETDINVVLLLSTTGLALLITSFTGLITLLLWVKVLALPGRLEYNRFNSAAELIAYAASVSKHNKDQKLGDLKMRSLGRIPVGISTEEPHVGPLPEPLLANKPTFQEDELVGRTTRMGSFGIEDPTVRR